MAEKVTWTFAARVLGGPTVAQSGDVEVEAYVKLAVTIKKNTTQDVEVFPGGGGGAQLVIISPATPSSKLTYEVDGVKSALDGPRVLIGGGAVGTLGAKVGTLKFDNQTAVDADISILAGRDATP